jgi:16S rRNA A1518/A1519 N6-dimethyltransferase RsmA/KsgA/DIM1 with predicted DNA glycosylase/AP lyase activity
VPFQADWDGRYFSDEKVLQYYARRVSAFTRIVELMGMLKPPSRAWLDVGCGPGVLIRLAHDAGWQVSAIEWSHICCDLVRRTVPAARLYCGPRGGKMKGGRCGRGVPQACS